MAIWDKPKSKAPPFDPAEGHPLVSDGLRLLAARDWPALAAMYQHQPPSDRYHFIQGLGEMTRLDDDIPVEFDDAGVQTIAAGIRVGWAWRHRGYGRGNEVGEDNFREMRRCLNDAETMLDAVGEKQPADTTAIAFHIRTEMGLGGDCNILTRLLSRLGKSEEANIFAAINHLLFVAPKWHGSIEQMWMATNAYASKPHNAAWIALVARAHAEEWLYCVRFGDHPDLRAAYQEKMRDVGFRNFLGEIDDLFWNKAEETPMTGSEALVAHNALASFLLLLQAVDRARRHLERMGPCITETPWAYLGLVGDDRMQSLNDLRKRASLPPLRA